MTPKLTILARVSLLAMMLLLGSFVFSQTKRVTGKVTDANNAPIAGATVSVRGTTVVTLSGADGSFAIDAKNGDVLIISFVGMKTQEVTVANQASVSVSLASTATNLEEVVVTGYTSQRKKDITGSVAVVNVATMKQIPTGSPEQALQGQASGVTVITSGAPGGQSNIRIRGISSIANADPLVIIDGVQGSIHDLNVNDIESLQVLKDAGAASIYGVRGSNGVIIITTKKGRSSKARVTYDGYYGTQQPLENGFRMANTFETASAVNQTYYNSGSTPPVPNNQYGTALVPVIPDYITPTAAKEGDPGTDPATYDLYNNHITRANKTGTDWFHEIFKPAPIQSHTVSVSQGSEKSSFFFSLGYFNQQGTLIETYLKRYSARLNTQFNIGKNVRIGENLYAFYKQNPGFNNQNEGNAISHSYRENPIIPIHDIMGNYAGTISPGLGNPQNPVANMERTANNKGNDWQVLGNVFAEVDLAKHFTVRTSFGGTIDNYYYNGFNYTAYENAENNKNPNSFNENFGYNSSWTWTNTLNYKQTFGDHDIRVIVGTEAIQNYGRAITGSRGNYYITNSGNLTVDPNLWTLNFGSPNGQTNGNINGTPYQTSLWSQFGKLDYAFKDRYLLSATIRRDGSSVFDESNRYGVFPSVSAGWRVSRENFMQGIEWLNDLKLRAGWGKLGSNLNVGSTNAFSLFGQDAANSYYAIDGANNSSQLGIYASQVGNKNTSWEEDIVTNIGFDATFIKNKFDLSFEWYKKAISGLLFQPDVAATGGGASPAYINAGNIENKGIDASLTYHGAVGHDFKFDITATFTSYNNKVVSLPPGKLYYDRGSAGSGRIGAFSRMQPGHPLGAFFGYEELGLFQSDDEISKSPAQDGAEVGLLKLRDVNGDNVIDEKDRTFFGDPNPKWSGGLNLAASYKGFDFSMFIYTSQGNDVINYVRYWTDFPQVFAGGVSKEAATDSWRPDNTGAKVPKLSRNASISSAGAFTSYYMEDGSFIRCKSLIIGYTIPSASLKRVGIDRLRVYVQAANLFTITKYTGLDPELTTSNFGDNSNFGIDFGNYPANQKQFNFGVSLAF